MYRTRIARFALCLVVAVTGLATAASAATISIVDRGSYRSDGVHLNGNQNSYFGNQGSRSYRAFMVFDVSTLTQPVSSVSMSLELEGFFSGDASESFDIFDVSSDASTIGNGASGAAGLAVYNDLGSGAGYASVTANATDVGSLLNITLSAQAVADLNAARTGSGLFAVGFTLTSAGGNQGLRWGTNGDWDSGTTVTSQIVTTPEPGTALLVGSCLLGLAVGRGRGASLLAH